MDFMGVFLSAPSARDAHLKQQPRLTSTAPHDCSNQVHAAARALPPPPPQQTACCVVDGRMPSAAARLTLQVSGEVHAVASLATSPRYTAVSETTAQLTIFYAGSVLVFENIPREKVCLPLNLLPHALALPLAIVQKRLYASTCRMYEHDEKNAEEIVFFAAKTTPDVGVGQIPAHDRDAGGLIIHNDRSSACSHHLSSANGLGNIKETNTCSPQFQIGPRADVSLLVRNPSLVSFLERRKQRLAKAAVAYPPRENSPDEMNTFSVASPRNKTPHGYMEQKWAFTYAKDVNGNHDDETVDTDLRI
uniref:Protein TIFY n=2 Tax=Leersia perrieri TaxID=77586 RepID=A0A0D9VKN0_9ORYZ